MSPSSVLVAVLTGNTQITSELRRLTIQLLIRVVQPNKITQHKRTLAETGSVLIVKKEYVLPV